MADKWFFDDDIAERPAHSQRVHDCRILLLSDNLSIVLCCNRGRSRDFRLSLPRSDVLPRCVWRATSAFRWIPSEFNSSDRGSRKHDNVFDATKSLADRLG